MDGFIVNFKNTYEQKLAEFRSYWPHLQQISRTIPSVAQQKVIQANGHTAQKQSTQGGQHAQISVTKQACTQPAQQYSASSVEQEQPLPIQQSQACSLEQSQVQAVIQPTPQYIEQYQTLPIQQELAQQFETSWVPQGSAYGYPQQHTPYVGQHQAAFTQLVLRPTPFDTKA